MTARGAEEQKWRKCLLKLKLEIEFISLNTLRLPTIKKESKKKLIEIPYKMLEILRVQYIRHWWGK